MQYAQLVEFTPLESIIEINAANRTNKAKQLVASYVISNEMADRLINLVFVQLQFEQWIDNKGLLIIGHYGTGKSHLMAMISSIAENAQLVAHLNHSQVAQQAAMIAGQFQVLRIELGATTMSLRDILIQELETFLQKIGIPFHFPAAHHITNNKNAFINMMVAFTTHYPNQGLLLIVDELLDYLRTRQDQELILDLSFLREIGEICKNSRFRFIAGLQESIFDNQRFEFVAHALRRVKDRFEQVLITRQDIKFVVAERLLKKNRDQQDKIQDYLTRFFPYYDHMKERITEFVALFPVHPDYIDTFAQITVIEKREILKTLDQTIRALADTEVPHSHPGLLTYDSYWNILCNNPAFRTLPDIREVIECNQVLTNRIEQAFSRPSYKTLARRIINGLSVHRLTTHDIHTPIGVTARELRDSLCLHQPGIEKLGGHPADDLLSLVETVLREILNTVNRQFITFNPENGQYYIDFKKNYDFDAIIDNRANSLDPHQLDRYYYAALRQLMEVADLATGWTQSFCWAYELEWRSHQVTRPGYLVFGSPNQLTNTWATKKAGFLLYFLPVYQPTHFEIQLFTAVNQAVFFHLSKIDDLFTRNLRLYAAADDLAATSAGVAKAVYESKAQNYLREVIQWLQTHKPTAFTAHYQNRAQTLLDWINTRATEDFRVKNEPFLFQPHPALLANFRDLIDLVADICLDNYFTEMAPEYPIFPTLISQENFILLTQEAIRGIPNVNRSKPAQGILAALELLNETRVDPHQSKYAQAILNQLSQKSTGQVLNRTELLAEHYFAPTTYRLEPELVIVLIAALVYSGELVLVMPNQIVDATQFASLAAIPMQQLLEFNYLERPKDFNLPALTALFELLALPIGLEIALIQRQTEIISQFQSRVSEYLDKLVKIPPKLTSDFTCWGKPLFSEAEIQHFHAHLAQTQHFLESLQVYSAAVKFKNFRYSAAEVINQQDNFHLLDQLINLQTLLTDLNSTIAYLTTAQAALPPQHNLINEMNQVRDRLFSSLKATVIPLDSSYLLHQSLLKLKQTYIQVYYQWHQQARLSQAEQLIQQQLLADQRLLNLKQLAAIALLPTQQLLDFETRLSQLPTCTALTEPDLMRQAVCPHCGYKPILESHPIPLAVKLTQLSQTLEQLYTNWTQILLTELENSFSRRELLKPENRVQIEQFLLTRTLPAEITPPFIEALQEGLADLIKLTISPEDLTTALLAKGSPITIMEMQKRINDYLNDLIQGKAVDKIRIFIE
jgi:Family of unknown function (DUF6079)